MKSSALCLLTIAASLTATALTSTAAIVVPGANGTDGVLNITADTEIDLSQAVTGTWDQNNTANAGKGVYDASKWAVVFKYTSVTVAAGKTVTFKNHASRAPVVWLVSGNVTIDGTVSLDGKAGPAGFAIAEPGPGGFRGGAAGVTAGTAASWGFGVGGGNRQDHGRGGSYGTAGSGTSGVPAYGNPSLIPLVGGSGGGSGWNSLEASGGAGGGAILIACANSVSIAGTISAKGGNGRQPGWQGGGGSGGGVRIVADSLIGSGSVSAAGGGSSFNPYPGGVGRIRLERVANANALTVSPDPSVVPLSAGAAALVWPPSGAPEVRVVSIGGVNAPADPRAAFGSAGADVALPQTTSSVAVIETTNVEQASTVQVRLTPRSNAANVDASTVNATVDSVVSVSPLVIRWVATLPVQTGYSAVQVKVIRP